MLRAAQIIINEGLTRPDPDWPPRGDCGATAEDRLETAWGTDFEVVDPASDERYKECWTAYHQLRKRWG
jgi:malate dehydrogenase (oxaloacetate-decarboxylating)(NADP+)